MLSSATLRHRVTLLRLSVAFCILLAIMGVESTRYRILYFGKDLDLGSHHGVVWIAWGPPGPFGNSRGWCVHDEGYHGYVQVWWPYLSKWAGSTRLDVPYWIPLALATCGTVVLWRFRRRAYGEGCCQKCGYDLSGAPHTRCPECGTPCPAQTVLRDRARAGPASGDIDPATRTPRAVTRAALAGCAAIAAFRVLLHLMWLRPVDLVGADAFSSGYPSPPVRAALQIVGLVLYLGGTMLGAAGMFIAAAVLVLGIIRHHWSRCRRTGIALLACLGCLMLSDGLRVMRLWLSRAHRRSVIPRNDGMSSRSTDH